LLLVIFTVLLTVVVFQVSASVFLKLEVKPFQLNQSAAISAATLLASSKSLACSQILLFVSHEINSVKLTSQIVLFLNTSL
jgi:hypothetical protein